MGLEKPRLVHKVGGRGNEMKKYILKVNEIEIQSKAEDRDSGEKINSKAASLIMKEMHYC